jgi:hypothetical protein
LAPKQATTIPRLELCAAVLAVKAVKWIMRELKMDVDKIVFYNDSRIILGYIQNERRRFYVYVANRIQTIRNISDPTQWKSSGYSNARQTCERPNAFMLVYRS